MNKLVFRADGNHKSGLGHMYRVFALFEMLKNEFDCQLITSKNTELNIVPQEFQLKLVPDEVTLKHEPNWIASEIKNKNTWLILDGYQFSTEYIEELRKHGFKLAYVDDFANKLVDADVIINHSLAATCNDYKGLPTVKLALGTKYAILRPSFLEAAKHSRQINQIRNIIICFGGADALNLTLEAVKAVLQFGTNYGVNVVLGAAYNHQEVFLLAEKHEQIQVYKNLDERKLKQVMTESDLAIASASTILYEICSVKMPVICGYYVDNQKGIYEGSVSNKLIFGIGNIEQFKAVDFEKVIRPILQMESFSDYLNNQAKLFDEKIKARFINLFSEITYRKVHKDDLMQVFKWSNDPITRNNSYTSNTISLETHQQWFNKKLNDASSIIYMAEVNGQPAGMVRYEVLATHSVVGVLIDPNHRGCGLASIFLQATANLFFENHSVSIWAYIKKTNQASIKSFERAHYKKLKDELVEGIESTIYCLDKNYL